MADYNTEVRIHASMDNKQAKEGAEEIEKILEKVGKKAGEKTEVGIQWDAKVQKEAEENIDRILKKKKELAQQDTSPVTAQAEEPRVADFDWQASADYTQKVNSEIESYMKAAEESAQGAQEASEHYNQLRVDVEEYAKSLKELEEQGQYFGDADYDRIYVAWKNADEAVRQYASDLNNQTGKGQAAEAAKAAKIAEQQAAEKELENIRQNAIVSNQDLVSLMQEQEAITQRIATLKKAGTTDGYEEYDSLQSRLAEINDEIRQQKNGFAAAEQSGRKACETISRGSKKAGGLLEKLKSRVKKLALSLLVVNQIRKGFQAMMSAAQEGLKNLASYSKDYNSQMSALKSSSAQLKNAFATAFEPIVNMAIPYLVKLVDWMTKAADSAAQFLAALQGKSTYTKAKKQVIDYAKSLDTASKSAKRALASFDELNVLNKNDAGTSSGGEATGADAFETATVSNRISAFATETLAALQPFKDAISAWWQNMDFEPLLSSFDRLKKACEPFAGYLADGMYWLLENVLLPLGSWTVTDAAPAFLDLLSAALEALDEIVKALQPYATWLWENFLKQIAEWTGEKIIDGMNFLTEKLQAFSNWCKADKSHVELMSSVVLGFFSGILAYFTIKKIVSAVGGITTALTKFKGIAAALCSPVGLAAIAIGVLTTSIILISKNWGKLNGAQKAATILGGLVAAALAAAVAMAVFHTAWSVGVAAAAIVGGLAALGISTAILKSSGSTGKNAPDNSKGTAFYNAHDFGKSPLPMLANGAVIQGGRPFAAILGDQPAGQTNIETPLATMVEAFKIAQAEAGGGQYTFVAQLDGKEIFRQTVKQDQMYRKQTGCSAFVV